MKDDAMSGRWIRTRDRLAWTGVLFLLGTADAHAHLVNTGFGPFYDGLSHLLLTPQDIVPVMAMALLAGLSGARFSRTVLFVLPLSWMVGGMAGLQRSAELSSPAVTTLFFLVIGALVAADRKLPFGLVIGLAAALGLTHGYLNGTAMAEAQAGVVGLLGIGSVVFVTVALVAALVVSLRWDWTRIAVRVAGSWVAAMGLLLLGWTLRGGA